MKALRRGVALALCVVSLVLSLSVTAQATTFSNSAIVTIAVTDESVGNTAETFTVDFFDAGTGASYSAELSKALNWNSHVVLPAGKNYVVIVRGLDEGFTLVESADHSKVVMKQSYAFTDLSEFVSWAIIGEKKGGAAQGSATVSTYNGMTAEEAYQAFLDEVSFIEHDAGWKPFLQNFGKDALLSFYADGWAERYAEYVQGGTVEGYYALTPFEQFLWSFTYTDLAQCVYGSGSFSTYFGDKGRFQGYIVNVATGTMRGYPNSEVVISAYEKLMDWQYNYIVTEGNQIPYCFITGRSSLEEVSGTPPVAEVVPNPDGEEMTEQEREEWAELEEAVKEALEEEEVEKGIWDDTFAVLAKNALSLLILAVLAAVLGVVVYRRKKRNID